MAAGGASLRTNIQNLVGGTHHLLLVLDDNNSITKLLKGAEDADELLGVVGVEADAGLVQDIHRAN